MNKLKLKPYKTEFLLIRNKRQRSKFLSMFPIEPFDVKTNPAKSALNLGVIFDKNVTFRPHISAVGSSCFHLIRDLWHIHHHHELDSAKLLATALVSSRLDYCISLRYGSVDIDLIILQYDQNRLACIATKSPPFTRSLPLLRSLHWLPVEYCLRSICWPTKFCMKNSLFIFTPCFPHHSQPIH